MRSQLIMVLLGSLFLISCENIHLRKDIAGEYTGILRTAEKKPSIPIEKNIETLLRFKITKKKNNNYDIAVMSVESSQRIYTFDLKIINFSHIVLAGHHLFYNKNFCYLPKESSNPDNTKVSLCYDTLELEFRVQDPITGDQLYFVISKRADEIKYQNETPRDYTLNELIDRSLLQSFATKIEFQHVLQARQKASNAALSLSPRIPVFNIISTAATGGLTVWTNIFKSVGDLFPFIFPNRWINWRKTKAMYDAERYTNLITRADAANIVQGLGFSILRDYTILSELQNQQKFIKTFWDIVIEQELSGSFAIGTNLPIKSLLNVVEVSMTQMNLSLTQSLQNISAADGFINPEAVKSVLYTESIEDQLKQEKIMSLDNLSEVAVDRSLEIKQLRQMIKVSVLNRNELYASWIDPSSPNEGLGLGMITQIKLAKEVLKELEFQKQYLTSKVKQKVSNILSEYSSQLQITNLAEQSFAIQNDILEGIKSDIKIGKTINLPLLVGALRQRVFSSLDLINSFYIRKLSVGNMNRILYLDVYSKLNVELSDLHKKATDLTLKLPVDMADIKIDQIQ